LPAHAAMILDKKRGRTIMAFRLTGLAAALGFVAMLEPAQQVATGTWSGRSDVPPPAGFKPIFSYKVANDYKAFLVNQTKVAELRKRFEKYSGPVVNSGGVR
jgi:hypothetical protein